MVAVHNVNTDRVWFDHPKYCHSMLKPLGLASCQMSRTSTAANIGTAIIKRFAMGF